MKNNNATYTKEQLTSTERLAQIIASIPDKKRVIAVATMNAYMDGFVAGREIEKETIKR